MSYNWYTVWTILVGFLFLDVGNFEFVMLEFSATILCVILHHRLDAIFDYYGIIRLDATVCQPGVFFMCITLIYYHTG